MNRSRPSPLAPSSRHSSSSSSSSHNPKPRRRNSFASATASSLAHGGPSTMAPRRKTKDKENAVNVGSVAPTTPKSKPKNNEPVLSPTPYFKVLEEREGKVPSPPITRSAKKRKEEMATNMNILDDTLSPNDDIKSLMSTGLRFESPAAFCAEHRVSAPTATAAKTKERRNPLREPSPARGRSLKKLKTNSGSIATAPNLTDMKRVMTECFSAEYATKLETALEEKGALLQKCTELENRCDELNRLLSAKVDEDEIRAEGMEEGKRVMEKLLEEKRGVWEAEKERLNAEVLELREKNVGFVEQLGDLEARCQGNSDSVWEDRYNEKMEELQVAKEELAKAEEEMEDMVGQLKEQEGLLDQTKAELHRVQEENQEQADVLKEAQTELETANQHDEAVAELQDQLNRLRDEKAAIVEELNAANADLETKTERIKTLESSVDSLESDKNDALNLATESADRVQQLEQTLQTTNQDLESARQELNIAHSKLEGVQSPRSRSAIEKQHHEEVSMWQNRVTTLESRLNNKEEELAAMVDDCNTTKEELKVCRDDCEGLASELEETHAKLAEAQEKLCSAETEWIAEKKGMEAKLEAVSAEKADADVLLEELAAENEDMMKQLEALNAELATTQQNVADLNGKTMQLQKTLGAERTTGEQVEQRLTGALQTISGLESQVSSLDNELAASQQLITALKKDKATSETRITQLTNELSAVNAHLQSARAEIASLKAKLADKQLYCENFEKTELGLLQDIHRLNEIRRSLHNRVIQLSGNIRVYVRVRPMLESEMSTLSDTASSGTDSRPSSRTGSRPSSRDSLSSRKSVISKLTAKKAEVDTDLSPFNFPAITDDRSTKNGATSYSDLTKQTLEVVEPFKDRGGLSNRQKKWKFGFDRVFQPSDSQEDVWQGAEPLVQSCLDGFNVCMFAYGQTGSGKTHTMIGTDESRGLIPRSVQLFFDTKADIERKCKAQNQDVNIQIEVELLEIYNEEVRDLLSPNAGKDGKLIKVNLNSHDAVGNAIVSASCKEDVDNILKLAQSRRCVKATKSNAESSRSHLLFTIHFNVASKSNEELSRNGCLHIIDLAGSERVDKSGSVGTLLTEAKHINKSLSALTGVIEALQEKAEHIPYRDSKLTYLLRNSLGGDSKTLAIVCCSPQNVHFQESLSSIRFAAKASKVELKEGNKVDV